MEQAFAIIGCWMLAIVLVAALLYSVFKGRGDG